MCYSEELNLISERAGRCVEILYYTIYFTLSLSVPSSFKDIYRESVGNVLYMLICNVPT